MPRWRTRGTGVEAAFRAFEQREEEDSPHFLYASWRPVTPTGQCQLVTSQPRAWVSNSVS